MTSMAPSAASRAVGLQVDYIPVHELASKSAAWWQDVLGVAGFGRPPTLQCDPELNAAGVPVTASMTPGLGDPELCEVWRVDGRGRVDESGIQWSTGETSGVHIRYRHCEEVLFGALILPEQESAEGEAAALKRATETAYTQIFDLLQATQHRHLIRIWNYVPDINRDADGDERYRHFNAARQAAFRGSGRATEGAVPAACVLGSPAGSPLSIYFLAARRPPKMLENPRQTSAYHYPAKFGRHSPIFSRACVWGEGAWSRLFISGTASIVGHETMHRGDVVAQTRETLVNIGALLDEANRLVGASRYRIDGLKLKVYVRRPEDLPSIRSVLSSTLRNEADVMYLHADVCRQDLLVEIEAVG
jgi:enamine deaminase RidA (YjgF/YER057c/UK114 family)